jgi:hypothetical protein
MISNHRKLILKPVDFSQIWSQISSLAILISFSYVNEIEAMIGLCAWLVILVFHVFPARVQEIIHLSLLTCQRREICRRYSGV